MLDGPQLGTTSYYYDDNGNLSQILPPGVDPNEAGDQRYYYNQRNLLITSTVRGDSSWDDQATFVYDGMGNRVQQVDLTGSTPITTTYANDNLGLSQVLVAYSGNEETSNLFGLDLILQDTGADTLTLLTDGLGSVRIEMVDDIINTATTYDPYGNQLVQTGMSNTTYGFAGEQEDRATGLLYLRARYYRPSLYTFISRDPYRGQPRIPSTIHGYSYVYNSPVNLTDGTGLDPWWCDANQRAYHDIPSHGVNDAVNECKSQHEANAHYSGYATANPNLFPPLLGSNAPYLIYESTDGFTGKFCFRNSPSGTVCWHARSGARPGSPSSISALNEHPERGIPYISGKGFFSEVEGKQYPAGVICYNGTCYGYPEGTFPVDWSSLQEREYDNHARWIRPWEETTWGRHRIPLDSQLPPDLVGFGEDPNNLRSGLFIHGGNPNNPTYGCIRLLAATHSSSAKQEDPVGVLVMLLKQLDQPVRLFVITPTLPERPAGADTVWYNPFTNSDYLIQDGTYSVSASGGE